MLSGIFENRVVLCGGAELCGAELCGAAGAGGGEKRAAGQKPAGRALLLGGFDGLHKGHETLLAAAKATGKEVAAIAISGGKGLPIYTEKERNYIFAKSGISEVYPLDFAKIKDMSAAQFALAVKEKIAPAVCFCGEDFRFGAGGKASGEDFEKLSGIPVRALPVLKDENGEKIGAERIKKLLENGDVQSANALLCGGFILIGEVKKDRGVGAKIGFPTANIDYPAGKTRLKEGVYETRAEIGGKTYRGITNFGARPTFLVDTVVTETHFLGFSGDLYGETLTINFVRFLREIRAFSGADELIAQLKTDEKRVEEGK